LQEDKFKYFKIDDFDCQETGENEMSKGFIKKLDLLRGACGFPFHITSGYRSPDHSIEKRKDKIGTHAQGIAADIYVSGGRQRMQIVRHATALGFNGIGVAKAFVHVDIRDDKSVLWCY
jgi:uncharacterized protein YcbK (DUF882 family)